MTTMTITIDIKQVYGKEMIYPICKNAVVFAKMLKQKSLTRDDLKNIQDLGYEISIQQKEFKL